MLVLQVDCLSLSQDAAGSSEVLHALQHGLAPVCLSDPVMGAGFPAHHTPMFASVSKVYTPLAAIISN